MCLSIPRHAAVRTVMISRNVRRLNGNRDDAAAAAAAALGYRLQRLTFGNRETRVAGEDTQR
jgi:hypothetical protein